VLGGISGWYRTTSNICVSSDERKYILLYQIAEIINLEITPKVALNP
jgi:hypothetical protein